MMTRRNRLRQGNEGWLTSYADLITNLLIFFILIISASQIQTGKMEKIIAQLSDSTQRESLPEAARKVTKALEEQGLTKDVTVRLTDDGLELSFNSGVTFASGAATILPQMEQPLSKVLAVLQPYADKYRFAVEGHTDEVPISSTHFKSNWELSSERAMKVRERLEGLGIAKERIRVEAYADTKALSAEEAKDVSSDQLRAKRRRVVVRLY